MAAPELRSFDRVASVYDATRSAPPDVASAVTEALLQLLRHLGDVPHVLEVGIGTGRIAAPLAEAGVRITGIDISSKMLAVLREKRRDIDVLFAEAAHHPFRTSAFDAALFVHILHLVPDVEGTIRESMRAVRRGGALVRVSDDHDEAGYHLESGRIMWDVVEELTGASRPPDQHVEACAMFERMMREHGASYEERVVMKYDYPYNAREAMDHMRRRDFSSSWLIPEAAFDQVVAATERRYQELWGDLDANHPAQKTVRIVVARLP
jgi:ubiquinone/menaquinone biosynthesis C-methylase UbiE